MVSSNRNRTSDNSHIIRSSFNNMVNFVFLSRFKASQNVSIQLSQDRAELTAAFEFVTLGKSLKIATMKVEQSDVTSSPCIKSHNFHVSQCQRKFKAMQYANDRSDCFEHIRPTTNDQRQTFVSDDNLQMKY